MIFVHLNRVGEVQSGFSILVHLLGPLAVDLASVSILKLNPSLVYTLRFYEETNNPVGPQILVQMVFHDKLEVVIEVEFAPILIAQPVAWLILHLHRIVGHGKSVGRKLVASWSNIWHSDLVAQGKLSMIRWTKYSCSTL